MWKLQAATRFACYLVMFGAGGAGALVADGQVGNAIFMLAASLVLLAGSIAINL